MRSILAGALFLAVTACVPLIAQQACGDPPFHQRTWFADCQKYGGRVVDGRCVGWNRNWCNAQPSQPSPSDREAQARREEELRRRRAQQEEEESRRREEEEEAAFIRQRDRTAAQLKSSRKDGVGGQSNVFGSRGVTLEESGIKRVSPDDSARDLSSAWKRIHCANELARQAIRTSERSADSANAEEELTEVRYLAGQALAALAGEKLGVRCSVPPPGGTFTKAPEPEVLREEFSGIMGKVVAHAENAAKLAPRKRELQVRLEELQVQPTKESAREPVPPPAPPAPKPSPPVPSEEQKRIEEAFRQQKQNEAEHARKIEDVIKQQRGLQKEMDDNFRLLREAQEELNKLNFQVGQGSGQ